MFDFETEYGFKPPKMCGALLAIAIHKHAITGTQSSLIDIPEEALERQKWSSISGRIVCMGDAAFQGEDFEHWCTLPRLYDFVSYKGNSGTRLNYRGIDMIFLYDKAVESILEDPAHVTRD